MSTTTSQQEVFVRNRSVVSRKIEEETLVVPIRGGVGDLDSIYSFNSLGAELWELLEKEMSVEDMTRWVVDQYEVTFERAQTDIDEFLKELLAMGLVFPAGPHVPSHA
ncbi:MAG TPA: PqqD family protein [Candidatus Acidoferrum sp.]|nr:PqqD family protein [Candidatus Acidoferrum sp.]